MSRVSFSQVAERFNPLCTKIRLLTRQLYGGADVLHFATYQLLTEIKTPLDFGPGGYQQVWRQENHFEPFMIASLANQDDVVLTKVGEEFTYTLVLSGGEDVLDRCFGSMACEEDHGEESIFCLQHEMTHFELSREDIMKVAARHLESLFISLKVEHDTLHEPPTLIEVVYADRDDPELKFDKLAILKRTRWDIED